MYVAQNTALKRRGVRATGHPRPGSWVVQDAYRQKTIDMELSKLTGIKGVPVPNRPAAPQSPGRTGERWKPKPGGGVAVLLFFFFFLRGQRVWIG